MHEIFRFWRRVCEVARAGDLGQRVAAASIFAGGIALTVWWSAETMLGL
jgi:hypothetical protein